MEASPSTSDARRVSFHGAVDGVLPLLLAALGLLHPESPSLWFSSLAVSFAILAGAVLGGAGVTHLLSLRFGRRIQGERTRPAPIAQEAFETARAMFVAACLMAWPLTQWRLGHPTGMVWTIEGGALGVVRILAQTFAGVMIIDAWLYWKHRLLHTRLLFGFHKAHHAFRDPTPFAGFAVAPVEALLTFWPVLIVCHPLAVHYGPLYFGLVVGFILLNFYLHCGVTLALPERTLSRVLLNTSAFHNVHHARANTHFGEALTLWDRICGTRLTDLGGGEPRAPRSRPAEARIP
jgi:lathosterol oxidase